MGPEWFLGSSYYSLGDGPIFMYVQSALSRFGGFKKQNTEVVRENWCWGRIEVERLVKNTLFSFMKLTIKNLFKLFYFLNCACRWVGPSVCMSIICIGYLLVEAGRRC